MNKQHKTKADSQTESRQVVARGEEAVERPAVGKEELKSMKQDGGKKSEKEGRDWREWEKTEACMGGGPPATAAFSPTQDWDLL